MTLKETYQQIQHRLSGLDLDSVWSKFSLHRFALYNDTEVILDGISLPKTEEFVGNTAIRFQGDFVAIWYLPQPMDPDILTSKIVHEMFHAYQAEQGESRFPHEIEALLGYDYDSHCMSIKYRENILLAQLCETFDPQLYAEFLALRAVRERDFPFQYRYDSSIEVVEGSAQYVELQVLRQLSPIKYDKEIHRLIARLRQVELLRPVRILSYDVGAIIICLCHDNNLPCNQIVGPCDSFLLETAEAAISIEPDESVIHFLEEHNQCFRSRLNRVRQNSPKVMEGLFELIGVNVYSAIFQDNHISTEYFLQYRTEQGETQTLMGNYLLEMKENKIIRIVQEDA